ncbi:MAG: hypothetical protein WBW33_34465 [Bryobacteraceae bacterium]
MSVYITLCAISTCLSLATYALLAWLRSGFSLGVPGLLVLFGTWYGICWLVHNWNRKRRAG